MDFFSQFFIQFPVIFFWIRDRIRCENVRMSEIEAKKIVTKIRFVGGQPPFILSNLV